MTRGLWKSVWLPSPQQKGCREKADRSLQSLPWDSFPRPPSLRLWLYLGADAEVVVRDELWALMVASVHPAVEGTERHAGQG